MNVWTDTCDGWPTECLGDDIEVEECQHIIRVWLQVCDFTGAREGMRIRGERSWRELINKRRALNGFIFSHGHFSHDFPSLSALSPPALEEAVSDSVASGQSYIHWTEGL